MIAKTDKVLAAWGESCVGPGWGNSPVVVLVIDTHHRLRTEYIQPAEQTHDMAVLWNVSRAANEGMIAAVCRYVEGCKDVR